MSSTIDKATHCVLIVALLATWSMSSFRYRVSIPRLGPVWRKWSSHSSRSYFAFASYDSWRLWARWRLITYTQSNRNTLGRFRSPVQTSRYGFSTSLPARSSKFCSMRIQRSKTCSLTWLGPRILRQATFSHLDSQRIWPDTTQLKFQPTAIAQIQYSTSRKSQDNWMSAPHLHGAAKPA